LTAEHDDDTSPQPDESEHHENETLLAQMGGVSGLIYSTVPILVFVPVNSFWGLTAAIWAAIGAAALILVIRLVRHDNIQPAISGFIGVAICAFIAHRTGSAKGYFLFGIWTTLLYAGLFVLSIVVRWPLVGLAWEALNGKGTGWRKNRRVLYAYDIATAGWAVVFAARYVVQHWLYNNNDTGALAVARIAMGWPLTAVAALLTVFLVRRAERLESAEEAAAVAESIPAGTDSGPADDGPPASADDR